MNFSKPRMSLVQKISYVVIFILLIVAFIYLGTKDYGAVSNAIPDSLRFTEEFGISQDNVFVYKNRSQILEALNHDSAFIFMASSINEWSSYYASLLNDVAHKENVKEIYYYDFYADRLNNNRYYENIVDYLSSYTTILDDGSSDIYSPTFVIVKNGKVLFFDNETAVMSGEHTIKEYWTTSRVNSKKESLANAFKLFKGNLS